MATKKPVDHKTRADKLAQENERLKIKIEMLESEIKQLRNQPISYDAYSKMHNEIENFCKR